MKTWGIDLDGCTYDFIGSFSKYLKSKLNIDYDDSQITDYNWYECIDGITAADYWREFHNFGRERGYFNLEPKEGALDAVDTIIKNSKGHHFITGRPEYAKSDTLLRLFYDFRGHAGNIHFSDAKICKSDIVNKLGVNVFVEDAPHYALALAEKTDAHVYLFDATYNTHFSHPNVTRVRSWKEILDLEGLSA